MRSRFPLMLFRITCAALLAAVLVAVAFVSPEMRAFADETEESEAAPTEGAPAGDVQAPVAEGPEPGLEPTPAPTAVTPAPPAAPSPKPMAEMHGQCSSYGLDLAQEFKRWSEPAFVVRAGTTPDSAGPLESGKRMEITLEREEKVRLAVTPEKPSKRPSSVYGGLVRFRVPKDGTYRIAAGNRLWLEVVNARAKSRVPEKTFEMQTKCPSIAKVIVYDLKAGDNYWLQLTNSDLKRAEVLVHAAP